jgi:hypothetical protein
LESRRIIVLVLAVMCVMLTGILCVAGSCALNVVGVFPIIFHVAIVRRCGGLLGRFPNCGIYRTGVSGYVDIRCQSYVWIK